MIRLKIEKSGGFLHTYDNPADITVQTGGTLVVTPAVEDDGSELVHMYSPTGWVEAWTENVDE